MYGQDNVTERLGALTSEKLPTDYDREASSRQPFALGEVEIRCTAPQLPGIDAATLPAALVAVFGVLVKRYVREPDIEVAVLSEDGTAICVPLHGVVSREGSVLEAVGMVDSLMRPAGGQALQHVSELPVETDLTSRAVVCGVSDLPREWVHVAFGVVVETLQADLCLHVRPSGFALRYNAKLFAAPTMQAMMRSWETLLGHVQGDVSVSQVLVPVVSPEDTQRLISDYNATAVDFLPRHGIHELFEAQADTRPSHTALLGPSHDDPEGTKELTYGQVESSANQLSHHLFTHCGVRPGAVVGILLERCTTFYVSMLAVLKAGAAYVSIDPDYPNDRIEYMLTDSSAAALITTTSLASRVPPLPNLRPVHLDSASDMAAIRAQPTTRPCTVPPDVERLCYIIYTSGSTGRPKGVQISHANALNLIFGEERIYGVQPSDRVLQGFSTSFDASVEEIWMALNSGATLVVGTKDIMRSGPDFPMYMQKLGVTHLSTVPTLLSTLEGEMKGVKVIITGGEACSKELVTRWADPRAGRKFFNTYGPTEATVIATYKECVPGPERMSIGRPLPNYQCYIVDDHMNLLPPGAVGELVIGGVSVSRHGYLNIPEKTASVFRADNLTGGQYPLYKSGDLARFSPTGDIEYYGRADSQVKIRGYRVELSEIESVLCELPEVTSAVVDVQSVAGNKHLVAFVILSAPQQALDTPSLLTALRTKLPQYMIPSHIEPIESFPTLPSGKVERRRLPRVMERITAERATKQSSMTNSDTTGAADATGALKHTHLPPMQREVIEAFESVLGAGTVTEAALKSKKTFFDLGGNSLLVSRLVTELRLKYPAVTSRDIYQNPAIEALAVVLERSAPSTQQAVERKVHIPTRAQTLVADVLQTVGMYFGAAYMGLNSLTVYILYFAYRNWPVEALGSMLAGVSVLIMFAALALNVAVKWVVLGRVREGDYPLWGSYHLRFWLAQRVDDLFRAYYSWLFGGTVLNTWYYRLMGTRVGRACIIDGMIDGWDLVEIGNGVSINALANISAVSFEDNFLKLRRVRVGNGVTVGVRSMVQPGTTVGHYAKIEAMSLVASGTEIPPMEKWAGAPAHSLGKKTRAVHENEGLGLAVGVLQVLWVVMWRAMSTLYLLPFLFLIRSVHLLDFANLLDHPVNADVQTLITTLLDMCWLFMAVQIGVFLLSSVVVAALKRVMLVGMNDLKVYPVHSLYYFRRWAVEVMMQSMGAFTKQLRGSVYLPLWYRLMGTKMGKYAEISSYINVCAEKLTLGDHVFVADDIALGMPHVDSGMVTHEPVRIGNRSFVGNASVVRNGTRIPDQVLVGVQSLAPRYGEPKETYLGSPPLKIQREGKAEANPGQDEAATYNPRVDMLVMRYVVEGLGFLLLHANLSFAFACLYIVTTLSYYYIIHNALYVALLPIYVMGHALLSAILTLAFKWLIIGRFKPGSYPLYGTYVWRTELVERLEENIAQPMTYPLISGTVYMQWFFMGMGVKMGKRAYLDHPSFCEPDLVTVGDYVNIERNGTLQAHLFQDRVRTTGPITIGNFCSIGSSAVVLLNGVMGDKTVLSALSLVMRSEGLPSNTRWHGLPAQCMGDEEMGLGGLGASMGLAKGASFVIFDDVETPHSQIMDEDSEDAKDERDGDIEGTWERSSQKLYVTMTVPSRGNTRTQ